MIHIDQKLIRGLIAEACLSPRHRKNLNFHTHASDTMHRMLHAMEPDTYVQPHKHELPDKSEAFIILAGKVAALQYSDAGKVEDFAILSAASGVLGVEFAPRQWHSLIALEPGSVVYEVKDGPWDPADDKHFASWAPREGEEECRGFNARVLSEIGLSAKSLP
jgi:cupin fold WbuC family metalloprotein